MTMVIVRLALMCSVLGIAAASTQSSLANGLVYKLTKHFSSPKDSSIVHDAVVRLFISPRGGDLVPLSSNDETDAISHCVANALHKKKIEAAERSITNPDKFSTVLRTCAVKYAGRTKSVDDKQQCGGFQMQTDNGCRNCVYDCIDPCPAADADGEYCTGCTDGFFEARYYNSDGSFCSSCDSGCADDCPASHAGDYCTQCKSGYILIDTDGDGDGYCKRCDENHCTGTAVACGSTFANQGDDVCTACDSGYSLRITGGGRGHCTYCDRDCATTCPAAFSGDGYCTSCNSGFVLVQNGKFCVDCNEGCTTACPSSVQDYSAYSSYCRGCEADYYLDTSSGNPSIAAPNGECRECDHGCEQACPQRFDNYAYCLECKSGFDERDHTFNSTIGRSQFRCKGRDPVLFEVAGGIVGIVAGAASLFLFA